MRRWIPAVVLCLSSLAPLAEAAVPSPANSSVDPCLIVCPSGNVSFVVVVRDFASNPVVNSTVVIDFGQCPTVILCPSEPSDPYIIIGQQVIAVTNAVGRVDFPIRAGGVCLTPSRIVADGVILGSRPTASFDQNGSLLVDAVDLAIVQTKLGTFDPTADFDCNGVVDALDLARERAHDGHACEEPVPARPTSWGTVKAIYR